MKIEPYYIRTSFGVVAAKLVEKLAEQTKPQPDDTGDKPKADLPDKGKVIDIQA